MSHERPQNILDQIASQLMAGECPKAEILTTAELACNSRHLPQEVATHIQRCLTCKELDERLRLFDESDDDSSDSSGWPDLTSQVMAQLETRAPLERAAASPAESSKQSKWDLIGWFLRPWVLVPIAALLAVGPVVYFTSNNPRRLPPIRSADNSVPQNAAPQEIVPPPSTENKPAEPQSAGPNVEPLSGPAPSRVANDSVLPANAKIHEKDTQPRPESSDLPLRGLDAPLSASPTIGAPPVSNGSSLIEKRIAPSTASNPTVTRGSDENGRANPIRLAAGTQIYLRILWQSQPEKNAFSYEAILMSTGNLHDFPIEAGSRIDGTGTSRDGKVVLRIDNISVHNVRYNLLDRSTGEGPATSVEGGHAYVMWLTNSSVYETAAARN